MKDLQSQESPEAIAYLRSMGEELGYIKAADLKSMAENAAMFADIFMRVLPSTVASLTRLCLSSYQQKVRLYSSFSNLNLLSGLEEADVRRRSGDVRPLRVHGQQIHDANCSWFASDICNDRNLCSWGKGRLQNFSRHGKFLSHLLH